MICPTCQKNRRTKKRSYYLPEARTTVTSEGRICSTCFFKVKIMTGVKLSLFDKLKIKYVQFRNKSKAR